MNESFIFYASFAEAIKSVPVEHRLQCYEALTDYALTGEYDDTDVFVRIIMAQAVPQIDANFKRRENGAKGAEFGKKGGRPKKNPIGDNNKNPIGVIDENPTGETTETPNVNVNDNVECLNDNGNGNDNDLKENTPTSRSKKENTPKFNFKKKLLELGVDEAVADEWIAIRKLKKKTNSEYALSREIAQVEKAGITMDEALTICCDNGWGQFKAEWLGNLIRSQVNRPTQRGGGGFMTDAEAQAICDAGLKLHEFIGRNRQ